jgi:hypothetical protein
MFVLAQSDNEKMREKRGDFGFVSKGLLVAEEVIEWNVSL